MYHNSIETSPVSTVKFLILFFHVLCALPIHIDIPHKCIYMSNKFLLVVAYKTCRNLYTEIIWVFDHSDAVFLKDYTLSVIHYVMLNSTRNSQDYFLFRITPISRFVLKECFLPHTHM